MRTGTDAVSAFPDDRNWDLAELSDPDQDRPGSCRTGSGGFLYDAGDFDAEFFGISPARGARRRPAAAPPPGDLLGVPGARRHRPGDSLRGSSTGVFAGLAYFGYGSHFSTPEAIPATPRPVPC